MKKSEKHRLIWRKTTGNRCSHCGNICYCNKTVDHVVPKAAGGTNAMDNLMPVCEKCNKIRGAEEVNPWKFYKYAKKEEIARSVRYKNNFNKHCV